MLCKLYTEQLAAERESRAALGARANVQAFACRRDTGIDKPHFLILKR